MFTAKNPCLSTAFSIPYRDAFYCPTLAVPLNERGERCSNWRWVIWSRVCEVSHYALPCELIKNESLLEKDQLNDHANNGRGEYTPYQHFAVTEGESRTDDTTSHIANRSNCSD